MHMQTKEQGVKFPFTLIFQESFLYDLYMARHATHHRKWEATLLSKTIVSFWWFFFPSKPDIKKSRFAFKFPAIKSTRYRSNSDR